MLTLALLTALAGGPADSLVPSHPCHAVIGQKLESWRATDEILRAPPGPLGGDVFRIATDTVGVWVTLHIAPGPESTISLFLTDSRGTTRLDYGKSCEPTSVRISAPSPTAPHEVFTDAHLKALLGKDPRLVVYLWSPHLPLSVDGYREIEIAAAALDIRLQGVVDPSAANDYVQSAGREAGIPSRSRRRLDSVELLFRDLAVHAPSIIVFDDERVSAPLPGYRNADAYRAYLAEFVEAISE